MSKGYPCENCGKFTCACGRPTKTCEYCQTVGEAFTFISGETICAKCLRDLSGEPRELRHKIYTYRKALLEVTDCQGVSCGDQSENVYQTVRQALGC